MSRPGPADRVDPLSERLRALGDPAVRAWWQRYVIDAAPFFGVRMPVIRREVHAWARDVGLGDEPLDERIALADALLRLPHSEEKLAGTLLLAEDVLPAGGLERPSDVDRLAALFVDGAIADWNVCDWFCVKVLGPLITRDGEAVADRIAGWAEAPVLWQARASLVAFVPVAKDPDHHPRIESACAPVIGRPERFAKTAVGWILREVGPTDPPLVVRVVERHLAEFSSESLRNATRSLAAADRIRLHAAAKALPGPAPMRGRPLRTGPT